MKFPLVTLVAAVAALFAAAGPGLADAQADAEALFAAETVAKRAAAIDELENADPSDPIVPYALGAGQFFAAVEGLGQALNRHGFEPPRSFLLPLLSCRCRRGPSRSRSPMTAFAISSSPSATACKMPPTPSTRCPPTPRSDWSWISASSRIDLDGDGAMSPAESLAAIMAALGGPGTSRDAAGAAGVPFRPRRRLLAAGLCQLLVARADFWLAHDFQNAFDGSFHAFPARRAAVAGGAGAAGRSRRPGHADGGVAAGRPGLLLSI